MAKLHGPLNLGLVEVTHRLVALPVEDDDLWATHATEGGLVIVRARLDETTPRRVDTIHARSGRVIAVLPEPEPALVKEPAAYDDDGIEALVEHYRVAAAGARDAGFDGIELDASGASLPARFLFDGLNRRRDDYGGTIDDRITFLARVVEALADVLGAGRLGVRLAPWDAANESDPTGLFVRVLASLGEQEIAYVHLAEDPGGATSLGSALASCCRAAFPGVMLFSGAFGPDEAARAIDSRLADAIGLPTSTADPGRVRRVLESARRVPS